MQNCWVDFFSYLSNQEIVKLDLALTDISLRKVFFNELSAFYLANKIYSLKELAWILARNIKLTKCHLDFEGNIHAYLAAKYTMHYLNIP